MGTVPIVIFRAWGHGELKPPHPCRMEEGAGSDHHDGTYVPGRPLLVDTALKNVPAPAYNRASTDMWPFITLDTLVESPCR